MANANPTPKARFLDSSQFVAEHRKLLADPAFERALDYAMLQFCRMEAEALARTSDAVGAGLRVAGAAAFAAELRNLAEKASPGATLPSDNLDHHV